MYPGIVFMVVSMAIIYYSSNDKLFSFCILAGGYRVNIETLDFSPTEPNPPDASGCHCVNAVSM